MGIFFGKSSRSRITDQDRAVLQLKQLRDKIKQYQKKIEINLERDRNIAKKLLAEGKKDRARLLLRKKRYQEQLLVKTDTQLENLEKLTGDIEFAQVEQRIVNGLKVGNEALKKVNEMLNIEDIEKIMDETRESVDKQREIDTLLSGVLTPDDEVAVEKEYDELLADLMPAAPKTTDMDILLPDVPSDEVGVPETPEPAGQKVKTEEQKAKTERVLLNAP